MMNPATSRGYDGCVRIPRLLAKYALPVVVAPPLIVSPPACAPEPMVVEAEEMSPPVNVSIDVVAFDGNGSCIVEVASVPQLKTPAVDALTSHDALFKVETVSALVDAIPETEKLVVVAPF